MDIFDVITLVGGLAFFLYGMTTMSSGLERLAGGKLEKILRKLTSNPVKGLALGAGITAVVQSSSAVTVMLVGLVNSGIMSLRQAISVIMGSNIGTTVTAWILSLSGISSDSLFMQFLKPENFSPLFALVGIILMMSSKKKKQKDAGTIFLGFGILMYGMTMMSDSVAPLQDSPRFTGILTMFSNPVLGVLVGLLFTALMQSSSASVGVLQALSATGVMTYGTVIPIIMGQNIGTCISAVLACIGSNKNAKRVAAVHVLFNTIGTVIFLAAWLITDSIFDFPIKYEIVSPANIAVLHSIFNVGTTVLLFPFAKQLEKLAKLVVRDGSKKNALLDENLFAIPAFAVNKAMKVTGTMATVAKDSVYNAIKLLDNFSQKGYDLLNNMEEELDSLEDELSMYLVELSKQDLTDKEVKKVSEMMRTVSDFERLGDHAVNLGNLGQELSDKDIKFSEASSSEIHTLYSAIEEILERTVVAFNHNDIELAKTVEPLEEVIDDLVLTIKDNQITRMQSGNATVELGFILTDLLTNLERISDHCSNVAVAIIEGGEVEIHEYLKTVKNSENGEFAQDYRHFAAKYKI